MALIPQRFTLASFKRYEACIADVVKNWPSVTVFDPAKAGYSLETFTCRLRDAITAASRYGYTSSLFTADQFARIAALVVCAQRDGKVICGPQESIRSFSTIIPLNATTRSTEVFRIINPRKNVLDAFCLLLSEQLLGKPLLVELMDPQLLTEMQNKYDIVAELQPDGSTLIV